MNGAAAATRTPPSFWRTLVSLWDTFALSVGLGLALMLIGAVGLKTDFNKLTGAHFLESVDSLIWALLICVAVAYGKLSSKGDAAKTAGAGLGAAVLATAVTSLKGKTSPDLVDGVRVLFYPVLAGVVVRLEKHEHKFAARAWQVLVPLVLLPGIVIGVTRGSFWAGLAEVIFAAGCALILHAKKIESQKTSPSVAATTADSSAGNSSGTAV